MKVGRLPSTSCVRMASRLTGPSVATFEGMICGGAKHSERANSIIAAVSADPVVALIEAHRAAGAALAAAVSEKSRLEKLGDRDADGGTDAAHDAEQSALVDLIEAVPTTIAGVIASMRYIADKRGAPQRRPSRRR